MRCVCRATHTRLLSRLASSDGGAYSLTALEAHIVSGAYCLPIHGGTGSTERLMLSLRIGMPGSRVEGATGVSYPPAETRLNEGHQHAKQRVGTMACLSLVKDPFPEN